MSARLERIVPGALLVALLVAATGLVVQLVSVDDVVRSPGGASGARPQSPPTSPHPSTPSTDAPTSPSPEPDRAPAIAARPPELCAFDPSTQPGPLAAESSVSAEIASIAQRVEELRELQFEKDVKPVFQDADRMAAHLERELTRNYTRDLADRDERILEALGAIPGGTDLRRVVTQGLGGDVLGYYVPKTGRLIVQRLDDDESLGAGEKFVLAHELEHALADQGLGLPDDGESDPSKADQHAAHQAVFEGDATITMLQFATTSLTDEERLSLATDPSLGGESSLEDAPHFVRKTFEFPYDRGSSFVCALYELGGWKAVDRAYKDPPVSSAQVLFPQHYLDDVTPKNPRNPRAPGRGWTRHPVQSLGAADLLWLLEAPAGDQVRSLDDPERRVMGWNGGEVHLFTRGAASAVAMDLVAMGRSGLLCDSVEAWYRVSFPIERAFKKEGPERFAIASRRQAAVLRCRAGEVRLGIAPTVPLARALAG